MVSARGRGKEQELVRVRVRLEQVQGHLARGLVLVLGPRALVLVALRALALGRVQTSLRVVHHLHLRRTRLKIQLSKALRP